MLEKQLKQFYLFSNSCLVTCIQEIAVHVFIYISLNLISFRYNRAYHDSTQEQGGSLQETLCDDTYLFTDHSPSSGSSVDRALLAT